MAEEPQDLQRREHASEAKHEKGDQDRLGQASGALVLIWLGTSFLLASLGIWEWVNVWGYFLGGLGVIILLETLVRAVIPAYRRPILGRLIGAIVLISLGFGGILGLGTWWPLVVIIIGLSMLLGAVTRGRSL
jgi:hypothetical protein